MNRAIHGTHLAAALPVAALLLAGLTAPAHAQGRTAPQTNGHVPGYDRPDPQTQRQPDGHQHVVYWLDTLDRYEFTVQSAADAAGVEDLYVKSEKTHRVQPLP